MFNRFQSSILVFAGLLALSSLMAGGPAWALSKQHPNPQIVALQIIPQTSHTSNHSHPGEPFSASLMQPYCQNEACLPASTLLQGEVIQSKRAHRFHHPGYLVLRFEKATFADGSIVDLTQAKEGIPEYKIYDPKSKKLGVVLLSNTSSTAVEYGTTRALVELNETLRLSSRALSTTTIGLGAALSVAEELIFPEPEHKTIPSRIGWGLVNTTGIPDVVKLVKKQPDVAIKSGEPIKISLPLPVMNSLLIHKQEEPPIFVDKQDIQPVASTPVDLIETTSATPESDMSLPDIIH